jgi:hypothetical protein
VVADGFAGEGGIFWGPIVAVGEGTDKRNVGAKVTPNFAGKNKITVVVGQSMEHQPSRKTETTENDDEVN